MIKKVHKFIKVFLIIINKIFRKKIIFLLPIIIKIFRKKNNLFIANYNI